MSTNPIGFIPDLFAGISGETRVDFLGYGDRRPRAPRPAPRPRDRGGARRSFEDGARRFIAGEIDDDVFRVMRLNQGIYGQRQGGYNQMVRVKIPYGRVEPDQLEMLGYIAETYSRGWGHLTTRQNVQFHFVQLETVAEVLRLLGVGRPHQPRGVRRHRPQRRRLPPRRRVPVRGARHHARGPRPRKDLFLRNPIAQRLPRKFKINFSGCATDCGQAMFNDVGVIAVNRPAPRRLVEPGFKVFMAGGLGANPHPAQALEEFTTREDLLPTIEAILRTFEPLRQPRQQAAGPA